jgi:hypothetical protein
VKFLSTGLITYQIVGPEKTANCWVRPKLRRGPRAASGIHVPKLGYGLPRIARNGYRTSGLGGYRQLTAAPAASQADFPIRS